jgi:hypothetical protein
MVKYIQVAVSSNPPNIRHRQLGEAVNLRGSHLEKEFGCRCADGPGSEQRFSPEVNRGWGYPPLSDLFEMV